MRYFGESKYKECITKSNFCEMCCHYNIGINHVSTRFQCKKKCGEIIRGKSKGNGYKEEKNKEKKKK